MARDNKKSLFEWLTGSAGNPDDLSFDDLESGTAFSHTTPQTTQSNKQPSRPAPQQASSYSSSSLNALSEAEPEGELAIDVYQTPTHIVIKAMIAGVRPEDLDVSITRDMVTIRGKRERLLEGGTDSGDFFFQELYWGAFARTIVLPEEVDIEDSEATERHGLLVIRLPKADKGRQAKLKVRSN